MVDRERRKKLALHLRHFSVGLITNDEFEEAIMDEVSNGSYLHHYYQTEEAKNTDPIILTMLEYCWLLYDDTKNHKLTRSYKLSDKDLKIIARCILFLHSENEYEWPYFDLINPSIKASFKESLLSFLTFGIYQTKKDEQLPSYEEWKKLGHYDVWPFFKKTDYEYQLRKQPFLIGQGKI